MARQNGIVKRYGIVGLTYPFRGGIAQYTTSLYMALKQRHEVRLFSFKRQYPEFLFPGKTQLDPSNSPLKIPHDPILDPMAPWTWNSAAHEIARYKPDIVLMMWWNPFFALMFRAVSGTLRRVAEVPVVFLCHNVQPHEGIFFDRWLLRMAYRKPSHFLVQSKEERKRLKAFRPDAPSHVVFHPAYTFFDQGSKTRERALSKLVRRGVLGVPKAGSGTSGNDRRVLLFFGHVRHYKGLDVLIRALPKVLEHTPVELLVVGEFYESREQYEMLIGQLGLRNTIRIVDQYVPNEDVGLYFEAADVVILPYRSGTQSGVVPLAYQFERPVIVTRIGGIPEVVDHGRTGLLVETEDPDALSSAILRFYNEKLGSVFKPHLKPAANRLSWSALVDEIDRFLSVTEPVPFPSNTQI